MARLADTPTERVLKGVRRVLRVPGLAELVYAYAVECTVPRCTGNRIQSNDCRAPNDTCRTYCKKHHDAKSPDLHRCPRCRHNYEPKHASHPTMDCTACDCNEARRHWLASCYKCGKCTCPTHFPTWLVEECRGCYALCCVACNGFNACRKCGLSGFCRGCIPACSKCGDILPCERCKPRGPACAVCHSRGVCTDCKRNCPACGCIQCCGAHCNECGSKTTHFIRLKKRKT